MKRAIMSPSSAGLSFTRSENFSCWGSVRGSNSPWNTPLIRVFSSTVIPATISFAPSGRFAARSLYIAWLLATQWGGQLCRPPLRRLGCELHPWECRCELGNGGTCGQRVCTRGHEQASLPHQPTIEDGRIVRVGSAEP